MFNLSSNPVRAKPGPGELAGPGTGSAPCSGMLKTLRGEGVVWQGGRAWPAIFRPWTLPWIIGLAMVPVIALAGGFAFGYWTGGRPGPVEPHDASLAPTASAPAPAVTSARPLLAGPPPQPELRPLHRRGPSSAGRGVGTLCFGPATSAAASAPVAPAPPRPPAVSGPAAPAASPIPLAAPAVETPRPKTMAAPPLRPNRRCRPRRRSASALDPLQRQW